MTSVPKDDERTVMPEDVDGRTIVGDENAFQVSDVNALPLGTVIAEFEIIGLIGTGGFGIVYLAYDRSLGRKVAIKEYMPSAFAARMPDASVAVNSPRHSEAFTAGLNSFINEARLLAKFDHPSLVKVYRFWKANGTGYMVMPYYEGVTLRRAAAEHTITPTETWLRQLLAALLDALDVLHSAGCCHRDIAPDNILLLDGDRPLLLDFGAARHVIGDMTRALTVMLKPGYAPLEQYAESPSMKQGPWTDLYALSAVIYYVVTGQVPTPSVARVTTDTLEPLSKAARGRYNGQFLRAIDAALAVRPEDRPRSTAEFRRLLDTERVPPQEDEPVAVSAAVETHVDPYARRMRYRRWLVGGIVAATAGVVLSGALVFWNSKQARLAATKASEAIDQQRRRTPPEPRPVEAVPEPEHSAPPEVAKSDTPSIARTPFEPLLTLQELYEGRDRQHQVSVAVEKTQVRIARDQLRFSITSSLDGYVYVLVVGTNRSDFYLLFPNAIDSDNRIAANTPLDLPRRLPMVANGPPGANHFVVIVSPNRRDFSALRPRRKGVFEEFSPDAATALDRSKAGTLPLFAGRAKCADSTQCSESYGAAEFSIEEI